MRTNNNQPVFPWPNKGFAEGRPKIGPAQGYHPRSPQVCSLHSSLEGVLIDGTAVPFIGYQVLVGSGIVTSKRKQTMVTITGQDLAKPSHAHHELEVRVSM